MKDFGDGTHDLSPERSLNSPGRKKVFGWHTFLIAVSLNREWHEGGLVVADLIEGACYATVQSLTPLPCSKGECLSRLLPRFKRLPVAPGGSDGSRWLLLIQTLTLFVAPNDSHRLAPRDLTPQPLPSVGPGLHV